MNIGWTVEKIVMQPTTFCNINCSYCYLSGRDKVNRMSPLLTRKVAAFLENQDSDVEVIWHGGEPMSAGLKHFRELLEPLESVRFDSRFHYVIQTNATLINEEWCALFKGAEMNVGVSIDGPAPLNSRRVDWKGKETHERATRGLTMLRNYQIPFCVLCVVTHESLDKPEELYDYFVELGCTNIGFNIEEKLGSHKDSASDDEVLVRSFWSRLFRKWESDKRMNIREFHGIIQWMNDVSRKTPYNDLYDLFPSIAWNGDVVMLAPEFLDVTTERYGTFVIGNLYDEPLEKILDKAMESSYVSDYVEGVKKCETNCAYFGSCRGGVASNKYFEHGLTSATETVYCRNREQRLLDAVLENL